MPNIRTTLGVAPKEQAPKSPRFRITCIGNMKGEPKKIAFEIDAPDGKIAANLARRIIMLGRYTVEPV